MDSKGSRPLSAYLPQSENGSILVTSRSKAVALKLVEEKDIIAVEPMAQSHALALFEKKLGSLGEDDDLTELTAALEFMPLAIVQAAAYISERAPRYSTGQYLEDFRKGDRRKTSLLNYEGGQLRRDWEAKNSIIITWQISFEHIQRNRPSAADLLSLMSFFDRQGIPEVLVRNRDENRSGHISQKGANKHGGGEEEEDNEDNASESNEDDGFEEDVQILRNYSFLSVDTNRTFEMHALVQLAMRKWLEANGKLEQWKQCYIKNLSAEFPIGEYENWTYCQVLFPHAKSAVTQPPKGDGSLRKWASLLYNAAWYAWRKGIITEAVNLSEMAMEVSKKIFGQEHRETLRFISMAGLAYALGGRWKEAEELRVRVTEIRKRVLGDEHPETLISMANLASTYINQGRWKEAEELQIEQITIMKRVLGEQHPDMLIGMANLASIYRDQGRWKEAEELQVRVTEIRKRVLGEEHPNTLISMNNLALIYTNQGRWKEAEELQIQEISITKRVLGEEHPETLTSMNNLAFTWKRQGRNAKAIELMGQCVHLRTRIIGADHPKTLSSSTLLTKWQMADTRTED